MVKVNAVTTVTTLAVLLARFVSVTEGTDGKMETVAVLVRSPVNNGRTTMVAEAVA